MERMSRLLTLLAVPGLLLGLMSINYCQAGGEEHHQAFADEHGLPGPSPTILRAGMALTVLCALRLGWAWGARKERAA